MSHANRIAEYKRKRVRKALTWVFECIVFPLIMLLAAAALIGYAATDKPIYQQGAR